MSRRFWVFGAGAIVVSMTFGAVLGQYVTSVPQRSMARLDSGMDNAAMTASSAYGPEDAAGARDPAHIICKGCGPTLAERRQAAEMAGLDADGMMGESSDPVVRDYLRDVPKGPEGGDDRPSPVHVSPAAPSPAHRLPANIERFAANGMVERTDAPRPLAAPASVVTVAPPVAGPVGGDASPVSGYAAKAHPDP